MYLFGRKSLVSLSLVAGLVVAGIGWHLFFRSPGHAPDFDEVGGTILVYEIDSEETPPTSKLEALSSAIQKRLDPEGRHSITVRVVEKKYVEIRVPHLGKHHDEEMGFVKALIGGAGSLEFRILANKHDDEEAIRAAERYLSTAASSWKEFLKKLRVEYPETENVLLNTAPIDLVQLEKLLVQHTRKDRAGVSRFLRANFSPNEELKDLLSRAKAGLPPPPPLAPNDKAFKVTLNDGDHRISYAWVELSRSRLGFLSLDEDGDGKAWIAAERARNEGVAVESTLVLGNRMGGLGWETLLYSRTIPNPEVRLAPEDRSKKFEYFVLTRDPEPGKEVTGEYLAKTEFSSKFDRGAKAHEVSITFRLTPEGSKRLRELTTANRPPREGNGRRHLAVVFRGQVLSAPSLEWTIGEAGMIQGRFTDEETNALTLALQSGGPLPVRLKPQPVSEQQVPPPGKP